MNNKLIYLIKNFFLLVILIVFFNSKALSIESKIILKVDNKIITNIDIYFEAKYLKALNPNLKTLDENKILEVAKTSLIREKIKEIEISKFNKNVINDVCDELVMRTEKALKNGLSLDQIIWDPGLGFAKTINQNISILNNLDQITSLGYPVLIGPSRKRFIGSILDEPNPEARLWGTNAVVCLCYQQKVSIVRVHDVSPAV